MVDNGPGIQIVCIGTASPTVKRWIYFYLLCKQPFPFILLCSLVCRVLQQLRGQCWQPLA